MFACAVHGSFSSAWTVMALSLVLKCQIKMSYPPEYGVQDQTPSISNPTVGDTTMVTVSHVQRPKGIRPDYTGPQPFHAFGIIQR